MSHHNSIKKYQQAFREFADLSRFANPIAVTLTMKQGIKIGLSFQWLSREIAIQNFRHFMNLLNFKVYGKRFKRHGVRLQTIPVLEGDDLTRLHYHCIIDRPDEIDFDRFSWLIETCWKQTLWGYNQTDIQSDCDEDWTKYISKYRGKTDYIDSFDWSNTHLS